jgi:hypothetical protein
MNVNSDFDVDCKENKVLKKSSDFAIPAFGPEGGSNRRLDKSTKLGAS